ncbi:SusE domain-containing protein [Prevotella sp. 10(H)]|uniref:SusE domain-containing protein n=1 Tax=Prevotella sp. 10(H) TaxID=1158294 RepID=UPI0004A6CE6F|nr:SusE domain-containing protein [Prevotella sp. 10(H)]
MKNIYKLLYGLPAALIIGMGLSCSDDDKYRVDPVIEGDFKLTFTAPQPETEIFIDREKENEAAVTFSWKMENDITDVSTFSYNFDMDKAGNNFETVTKVDSLGDKMTKSYTNKELFDLVLNHWKLNSNEDFEVEARVKGTNSVVGAKTKTSWATIKLFIRNGYKINIESPAEDTRIDLTADKGDENALDFAWKVVNKKDEENTSFSQKLIIDIAGNNFESAVTLEDITSKAYSHQQLTDLLKNQWSKRAGGLVKMEAKVIAVNTELTRDPVEKTFKFNVENNYKLPENIYPIGSAAPAGWDMNAMVALVQDEKNPNLFVFEGELHEGELKFPTVKGDWLADFILAHNPLNPEETLIPITTDWMDILIISGQDAMNDGSIDKKWKIETAGAYKVTIDLFEMKIKFEKI